MASNNLLLQLLISAKDGASSVLQKLGGVVKWLDSTVSVSANAIRSALSKAFIGPVETASDFEEAMARINAVMRPTAAEFEALRTKAIEMGRDTRYTATEAASGLEILAKAGFTAKNAITALPTVLSLAQSQSISLAEAAGYLSDTLTIFGLSAEQSSRAANTLTKTANSANMTISDLGQSLKYVGPAANQAGLSLEQTGAILDVLAQSGLRADMAGTGLRDLLQDINDPASEARKSLRSLGIETNNFMEVVAGLEKVGIDGAQAIQDFGVRSSGAMMTISRVGVAGIKQFEQAIISANDANVNYAEKSRQIMDATVKGAKFALESSLEAAQLALATPILDPLQRAFRSLSDTVNNLVKSHILQDIGQDVADVFQRASTSALNWLKNLDWNQLKTDAKNAVAGIGDAITAMINDVKSSAQTASDWAVTVFSPLTAALNGYRIALAKVSGDEQAVAKVQAQIEAQAAAIGRALSGTSAEYAKLGAASQQAAQGQKSAGQSLEALTNKAAAQQAAVNRLTNEIEQQKAVTDDLAQASQSRVTADEASAGAIEKLWELQAKLKPLQTDLAKTQAELAKAQQAGAQASAAMTPEVARLTAAAEKQRARVAELTLTTGTLTDAHAKAVAPAAVIGREMEKLAHLEEQLAAAQKQAVPQQTALTSAQTQGAIAAQRSAAATEKNWVAWSDGLPVQEKAQSVQVRIGQGFAEITRATDTATTAQSGLRTETERLNSSAASFGNTQKAGIAAQAQATQTIEQYRQKVLETRQAVDEAAKRDANAADYTQKLNAARQEARNALDQLNAAIGRQATAAQQAVDTAIAQRDATIKANEANTAAVQLKLRMALAEQDAYAIGQQTVAQQVNVLRNAEALEAALSLEARRLQEKADAEMAAYRASLLNESLSAESRQKLLEAAQQSAAAAAAKRDEVKAIHEKVGALTEELSSQQTANQMVQQAAYAAEQGTAGYRTLADSKVTLAQASLKLAQATGDEQEIAKATKDLQAAQIEQAQALADSKKEAADAADGAVAALQRQAAADGQVTAEEAAAIQSAQAVAQAKRNEADAAQENADALEKEAEKQKDASDAASDAGKTYTLMVDAATAAGMAIAHQSQGVAELLDKLLHVTSYYNDITNAGNAWSTELSTLQQRLSETNQVIEYNAHLAGNIRDNYSLMVDAVNTANQAFLEQEIKAVSLRDQLKTLTDQNDANADALYRTTLEAERAKDGLGLLNKERLDQLQQAIDSANNKLRAMQDEAQTAKDRLLELDAELARARGDTSAADKIDLERQRLKDMQDVEDALAKARAANNRELIAAYEEQERKLKTLYALQETALSKKQPATETSQQTAGGGNATTSTQSGARTAAPAAAVTGSGGVTNVTNNFYVDPTQLASEEWVRKKVLPTINNVTRRLA